MANYVSKDEVKKFVRDVRIELDARYAAKFAPVAALVNVKNELETLKEKVANINTDELTFEEKEALASLTNELSPTTTSLKFSVINHGYERANH